MTVRGTRTYDARMEELDVTQLAPRDKHPTIHQRLAQLLDGETLRIYNDHDPRPLKFEIEADFPGVYSWNYVDKGPDVWRVDIGKRPAAGNENGSVPDALLDVRPYQRRNEEPFDVIMKAVDALVPGQSLLLINTFEPTPLFRVMEKRGFTHTSTCIAPEEYRIVFTPSP
jgi:regulator of cell morphogenesis and NO signaling